MEGLLRLVTFGFILSFQRIRCAETELLSVVIAEGETDSLRRYTLSAQQHGIDYKVFGIRQPWRENDVALYTDGGHKVNILKENLAEYAERDDLVVLYTENTDTVFLDRPKEILKRFKNFNANVVFLADSYCWPDNSLKSLYPTVGSHESRYINAGAFIGYAKDIVAMVNHRQINDMDSDQLYYTEIFVNEKLRSKWNMKVDTKSKLFQNLYASKGVAVMKTRDHNYIYNTKTSTRPIIIYGSGPVKMENVKANFLRLADYLTCCWTSTKGCLSCKEDNIDLKKLKTDDDYPTVQLSVFIDQPTPFITEALEYIGGLEYPKSRVDLFLYFQDEFHEPDVEMFVSKSRPEYASVVVLGPNDDVNVTHARHIALQMCESKNCQYLFLVEGHVHLTDPRTLKDLIEHNRSVVAPLLSRYGELWSNFWGALDINGYYARADDYLEIIEMKRQGLWNVPYINGAYLINGTIISHLEHAFEEREGLPHDMSFAKTLREKEIFMFVSNTKERGFLINFDNFDTSHLHNDLWQLIDNAHAWETRYIHKNYFKSLEDNAEIETPCSDVAWFPVVTEKFCDHMIEEMENYGKWSNGKNEDPRLVDGYENVPTVDIHMSQIGYDDEWLYFLKVYANPLQQKFFIGYYSEEPRSLMNFVVRYRPDEQPILRPHHDSSTWTINIALNHAGVDYTGGGVRFIRQNCTVIDTKKGWMFMHPGRLTHYHEGLRTLSGTRYILVSFVNP